MVHLHKSSECPGCMGMGSAFRPAPPSTDATTRLSTDGLEHIYTEAVEVRVLGQQECGEANRALNNGKLEALAAVIQQQAATIAEQSAKLEAAGYRVGYLEARVSAADEQLKLLQDRRIAKSRWSEFLSWFISRRP